MSTSSRAASVYREATLESAPPLKIIQMLYQGALRFMDQALALDPKADAAAYNERLSRADAIVCELRCSLERVWAPEVCDQLERLYVFVEDRIQGALAEREPARLEEATRVLRTLLEAWNEVEVQQDTGAATDVGLGNPPDSGGR